MVSILVGALCLMLGIAASVLTIRVAWSPFWDKRARINNARREGLRMRASASRYEDESRNSWLPWNRDSYHEKARDTRKQAAELEEEARWG